MASSLGVRTRQVSDLTSRRVRARRQYVAVKNLLTELAEPRPFRGRAGIDRKGLSGAGVARGVTEQMRSSRSASRFARHRNLRVPAIAIDSAVDDHTFRIIHP